MSRFDHSESTPECVDRFRGDHAFLSNFHRAPFPWCGKEWPTAEACFQAAKTRDEREAERIRNAPTPAAAKRLGRRVDLRPDWEHVKVDVMHSILQAKFAAPALRDALLATGDAELVEGNTWGDVYWGRVDGRGGNQLGRTLMRIREDIRRRAGAAMDEQHAAWLRERCDLARTGRCDRDVCHRRGDNGRCPRSSRDLRCLQYHVRTGIRVQCQGGLFRLIIFSLENARTPPAEGRSRRDLVPAPACPANLKHSTGSVSRRPPAWAAVAHLEGQEKIPQLMTCIRSAVTTDPESRHRTGAGMARWWTAPATVSSGSAGEPCIARGRTFPERGSRPGSGSTASLGKAPPRPRADRA